MHGELMLRLAPPKLTSQMVSRSALLNSLTESLSPCVLVQASAGFGKSSLLATWRRHLLSKGTAVAWVSFQSGDGLDQFFMALISSIRLATSRNAFGRAVSSDIQADSMDTCTAMLGELFSLAIPLALIFDDVDRLDTATIDVLKYLILNAPSNLQLVIGFRPDERLNMPDLKAYGRCVEIGQNNLRFQMHDTLELLRLRFENSPALNDLAALLVEATEGWPLGIQLLLAVTAQNGADTPENLADLLKRPAHSKLDSLNLMLSRLSPSDLEFLTKISCLDEMSEEICKTVIDEVDAVERLLRLVRTTPIIAVSEHGRWFKLHALVRSSLQARFEQLPTNLRSDLLLRAMHWYADQRQFELAAKYAYDAGQRELAFEFAERSLYDSLMTKGPLQQVLCWVDRMLPEDHRNHPRLSLSVAWCLALSDRHAECREHVQYLMNDTHASPALRCEAAMILSGAALFADDPDRFSELHEPWANNPPLTDPVLLTIHANRTSYRTLLRGDPALARIQRQAAPPVETVHGEYLPLWGELIVGMSYLWEGQVLLVDRLLRPALARAEAELGRRSMLTCMIAAVMATALWEKSGTDEAEALLANRMDVLEKRGLPEIVWIAYRTLSRVAASRGQHHRAIELLEALYAVGQTRKIPRLCAASLAEQIRLHARSHHAHTCTELTERLSQLSQGLQTEEKPMWSQGLLAQRQLGEAYGQVANKQWRLAASSFEQVIAWATRFKMNRLRIESLLMKAFCLHQVGEKSRDLLEEAISLAKLFGLERVFGDSHPELLRWVEQVQSELESARPVESKGLQLQPAAQPVQSYVGHALTPKEREVIELLSQNLSNKEIANALGVGEETVKWHMKNLFMKLDAGSRKQVVARARLLGFLA